MSPESQPPTPSRAPGLLGSVPQAIDRVSGLVGRTVLWLVAVMVAIGAYNAVARYLNRFTDANLASNAYLEAQWYLFSLVFLLGAAYALKEDSHVRVDVLYGRLGPRGKAWIDLAGTLLFLIPFCTLMLWVSWPSVAASWRVREVSPDPGGLPRYPIKAVVLLAFALLLLQGVAQALKQVALLRGAAPPAEPGRHRPEEV
ncbi:MAG TPA: TRAP transporter small permease subunit [Longimicrobiaceae bacterium]|nr:TRAP transporter small permease subunit [Longimicrobiaceae bacterium]